MPSSFPVKPRCSSVVPLMFTESISISSAFDMFFLIMSVYAGFGSQSYIDDVNKKIRAAREFFGPDIDIQVDGGINLKNKDIPVSNGANVLVAGTAVFGANDIGQAVKEFLK